MWMGSDVIGRGGMESRSNNMFAIRAVLDDRKFGFGNKAEA